MTQAVSQPIREDVPPLYVEMVDLYGPVLDLNDLSKVLRRNRDSLRNLLYTARELREKELAGESVDINESQVPAWALQLSDCSSRVGRKFHFRTRVVANMIESGDFA